MDEWRDFYEDAKHEFVIFGQALLHELCTINSDFAGVEIKQCLFRINRDIRFSKDKTPYKPWFGLYIAPWGKKSSYAWLYLHIEPWKSMIAGWCYELDRYNLKAVREYIVLHEQELEAIVSNKKFQQSFGSLHGRWRTTIPRWYMIDWPWSQWLMQDSWYAYKIYDDEQVIDAQFLTQVVSDYTIIKPLNDYFNEVIDWKTPLERSFWL